MLPSYVDPNPKWKYWIRKVAVDPFEIGEHEYIRAEGRFPIQWWLTIREPRFRHGWFRKTFPYRLRFRFASILLKWLFSYCTMCSQKITLRELLDRSSGLQYYQSGSICHTVCSRLYAEALKAAGVPK